MSFHIPGFEFLSFLSLYPRLYLSIAPFCHIKDLVALAFFLPGTGPDWGPCYSVSAKTGVFLQMILAGSAACRRDSGRITGKGIPVLNAGTTGNSFFRHAAAGNHRHDSYPRVFMDMVCSMLCQPPGRTFNRFLKFLFPL